MLKRVLLDVQVQFFIISNLDDPRAKPKDCFQLRSSGLKSSGVYTIYPDQFRMDVYCDMETAEGGWTVGRTATSGCVL